MKKYTTKTTLSLTIIFWVIQVFGGTGTAMEQQERLVVDFSRVEDWKSWYLVNDDVMGGGSSSEIFFTEDGTAVFRGEVSLENNGGFASVRSGARFYELGAYSGVLLQVRGDGRDYQLRLRTDGRFDGISYRYQFTTKAKTVQTIKADFSQFEPVFRGQVVEGAAPLSPENVKQFGFLIADNQSGAFRLEVDWIKVFK